MFTQLRKRWFLLALTAVAIASVLAPELLLPAAEHLDVRTMVVLLLFLMSLTLETRALVAAVSQPKATLLAVGLGYVVVPVLGWLAALAVRRFSEDFAVGVLIMCAMPCTLASATIWTRLAGGNDALALLTTVVSNGVSFLVSPLILWCTLGASASLDPVDMMARLFFVVVLPVAAGQACRVWKNLAAVADRGKGVVSVVSRCLVLTVVFSGLVKAALALRQSTGAGTVGLPQIVALLVAVVVVHLLAVAVCWYTGRATGVSRADGIAFLFAGSQKTLPAGLYVAAGFFPAHPLAAVPILFYHAAQLVADTYVAQWVRPVEGRPDAADSSDG